ALTGARLPTRRRQFHLMVRKIEKDTNRFKQIVRGKIKQDLRKYINRGEMIGRKGKNLVSIPLPQIEIPHFRYGSNQKEGVGEGDGDVGDPVDEGEGSYGGGEEPGEHILEVEISLEELAKILGEELELPNIKPRGRNLVSAERERYTGIRSTGPESLRHFKRTYKQALRRQLITGNYDPTRPVA